MTAKFITGNAINVLKTLPGDFIHCCVTSPPYFGLRSYDSGCEIWDANPDCKHVWGEVLPRLGSEYREDKGSYRDAPVRSKVAKVNESTSGSFCSLCGAWRGQLGSEPDPRLYIEHLISIMREVRRVLRKDGVFWLNIGDSWWAQRPHNAYGSGDGWLSREHMTRAGGRKIAGLKPLDMVLIPQYLALRARQDGWFVRSIIIWSKVNPMPESVNGWRWERHRIKIGNRGRAREAYSGHIGYQDHGDNGGFLQDAIWEDCPGCPKCNPNGGYILRKGSWRPTDSFEYILMLTKSNSYFCDKEAVTELSIDPESYTGRRHRSYSRADYEASAQGRESICNDSGEVGKIYPRRNMRSVWTFPTQSYSGAHFAVYPSRLPELCIRASTSEAGCCLSCGSPYARIVEKVGQRASLLPPSKKGAHNPQNLSPTSTMLTGKYNIYRASGWRPTCKCNAGPPVPCWILDPFSGAGTTALAAERLGRDSINIDTSEAYNELARQRLLEDKKKR